MAAIRLLIGGRGSGKTTAGIQEAVKKIQAGEPGLILAPDSEHFKKSTWPQINEWLPIDPDLTGLPTTSLVEHWSKGDRYIRFATGSTVWYGGIKEPDSWRGPNVNWIWYDEPGRHPLSTSFLIPIGSLRVGKNVSMWLTTTPRGVMHWLYKFFVLLDLESDVLDALQRAHLARDPKLLLSWHRASTWDNRMHLNPIYFAMLLATYHGKWREQELEGKFVSFEGLVYDNYDPEIHLIDPIKLEDWWPRWRVIDFGYKNPFVAQWWCRNPDGRYFRYREIYYSHRTVNQHAQDILRHSFGENIVDTICDQDAEDRATLEEHGIPTIGAVRDIRIGVQDVWNALELDETGKPDIYLFKQALVEKDPMLVAEDLPTCTEEEFPLYAWPRDREGVIRKEVPIDLHNHGMDSIRMLISTLEGVSDDTMQYGHNPIAGYRG